MAQEGSFARKQLRKHGWTEGCGLGKNETGIKEAIKVKVKQDSHGIGHRRGDEFTFHWWDHVFNKAASNIDVRVDEESVSLSKTAENGPISNKKTKRFDNKDMLYGKFVKGALLNNGKIENISNQDSDVDSDTEELIGRPDQLNDEELLKVCGGLTAHKAARHGHGLSGKLLRVQQQEKAELNRLTQNTSKHTPLTEDPTHTKSGTELSTLDFSVKRKKKQSSEDVNKNQTINNGDDSELKIKKKKKKKKKRRQEDVEENISSTEQTTDVCKRSKKRRKDEKEGLKGDNSEDFDSRTIKVIKISEDVGHLTDKKPKRKKKKKK